MSNLISVTLQNSTESNKTRSEEYVVCAFVVNSLHLIYCSFHSAYSSENFSPEKQLDWFPYGNLRFNAFKLNIEALLWAGLRAIIRIDEKPRKLCQRLWSLAIHKPIHVNYSKSILFVSCATGFDCPHGQFTWIWNSRSIS